MRALYFHIRPVRCSVRGVVSGERLIHPFIHPFIHSFIYSFIRSSVRLMRSPESRSATTAGILNSGLFFARKRRSTSCCWAQGTKSIHWIGWISRWSLAYLQYGGAATWAVGRGYMTSPQPKKHCRPPCPTPTCRLGSTASFQHIHRPVKFRVNPHVCLSRCGSKHSTSHYTLYVT